MRAVMKSLTCKQESIARSEKESRGSKIEDRGSKIEDVKKVSFLILKCQSSMSELEPQITHGRRRRPMPRNTILQKDSQPAVGDESKAPDSKVKSDEQKFKAGNPKSD